jgi:hypothetical protein
MIAGSFALMLLIVSVSLLLHYNPLCGEELMLEKSSPDGRYVAALMSRNCGATTAYVSHINVRSAHSRFRSDFFSGTITEGEVWRSSKYSGTRFCWSNPHRLQIGYPTSEGNPVPSSWSEVIVGNDYRDPECQ